MERRLKANRFRNVILCEDVRDEIGNKKSLMGIFSGDIVAAEIPARLWLAIYIEYMPEAVKEGAVEVLRLRLKQDSKQIVEATAEIDASKHLVSLVLPRALVVFEKECEFSLTASLGDGKPVKIMAKELKMGPVQPR